MITGSFVTAECYFIQCCLVALEYAHLDVDGITNNRYLYVIHPEKQVSIIHIQSTDVRTCRGKRCLLFKFFLVVNIALLEVENFIKRSRRMQIIAGPVDVTEIVLSAFKNAEMNVNFVITVANNAV